MRNLVYAFLAVAVLFLANIALAQDSYSSKYYQVYLTNKEGKIVHVNVGVKRGLKEKNDAKAEAIASLYSFSGEKLVATNFNLPKTGEQIILDMPYYSNGKEIRISTNTGEKLLAVPVAIFADTCQDERCQGHESFASCPEDCPSGGADGFCDKEDDGRCDSDCKPQDIDPDYPNCQAENQDAGSVDGSVGQNQNKVNISEKSIAENLMSDSGGSGQKFSLNVKIIIGLVVLVLVSLIFFVIKGMSRE